MISKIPERIFLSLAIGILVITLFIIQFPVSDNADYTNFDVLMGGLIIMGSLLAIMIIFRQIRINSELKKRLLQ